MINSSFSVTFEMKKDFRQVLALKSLADKGIIGQQCIEASFNLAEIEYSLTEK